MSAWLDKVSSNIFEGVKINRLRRLPSGDAYVIIFAKMLFHCKPDGFVCEGEGYHFFANEIGEEYEMLIMAIAILRELCLITLNEKEDVYIHQRILNGDKT